MKKRLCTLFCAALLSLPASTHLLASAPLAPAKGALASAARPQTLVDVTIYLPYEGRDNEWNITFTDNATGATYDFETDGNTFNSHALGSIPAGVYDVTFHAKYAFHTRFEYYAGCNDAIRIGYGDYTLPAREITTDCNNVTIDAWL